jgi:hypothetical protein
MADTDKVARIQEIVNRGLVGQLPQDKQAIVQEAIKRGIITDPSDRAMTFGEFIEPMATVATGALAEPIAGVAGIAQTLNPFAAPGAGAEAVEATREALTYTPESVKSQQVLGELGGLVEPAFSWGQEKLDAVGNAVLEMTGSPAAATAVTTTPAAVAEIFGLKGLKSIRQGTRLLDANGRPTKALRKQLDKSGLDFDGLSEDVKALIPEYADKKLLPVGDAKKQTEEIVKQQIKAGGTDDSLAGLKVSGNKVIADPLANETIKQGFREGVVQAVKTSSTKTKRKMLKMARIMRRSKKSERSALDVRPTDVVGESVVERIMFVRDQADDAKKRLDDIAENQLKGKYADYGSVKNTLSEVLDEIGVNLTIDSKTGKAKPIFEGSVILKDRSSQRAIRDLVDLMQDDVNPDAFKLHRMKRQLDALIDFRKQSPAGLGKEGKKVLRNVRSSINDTLRSTNKGYAEVNDILSQTLTALDDVDSATGTIQTTGRGASKALGTKLRALLSNQQGRVNLENALDSIESVAVGLGGKFDDDVKALIMFADALDDRFGTAAKTSLSGQVEQGAKQAIKDVATRRGMVEKGVEVAGRSVDKLRGINDFNAFEAIEKLLINGAKQ